MSKKVAPVKKITINPIEGSFDLITGNNFSYESVPVSKTIKIEDNMQMVVFGSFDIDGTLILDGSLIIEV